MKTVAYVSNDFFLDVDRQVIRDLNKHFRLHYYVVFQNKPDHIFSTTEVADSCKENGIPFTSFNRTKRARHPANLMTAIRLVKSIRKIGADIVYFETFSDPYLPIVAKLLLSDKRVIYGIHDVVPHVNDTFSITVLFNKLFLLIYDNIHVFSETQKKELLTRYPSKRAFVARLLPYDYGKCGNDLPRHSRTCFLFFGSIRFNKGLDCLIKAGEILAKKGLDFIVKVAGNCDDFSPYQGLIASRSHFDLNIRFIGTEEIPVLFTSADFLVLPYRDVTQSGPLMIAYNYHVPAIASDLPGFREYISDAENGFLYEPDNPFALADCMERAMSLSADERQGLVNNIRSFVRSEISSDAVIEAYRLMFDKVGSM